MLLPVLFFRGVDTNISLLFLPRVLSASYLRSLVKWLPKEGLYRLRMVNDASIIIGARLESLPSTSGACIAK